MKKLLFIILLIIIGVVVFQYFSIEEKNPVISVDKSSYDFGDIGQDKVETEFMITNNGNGILEIENVATSCGCTKGDVEKSRLLEGESTILKVSFDPKAMGDLHGKVYREVYIQSNDKNNPETIIKVYANVL